MIFYASAIEVCIRPRSHRAWDCGAISLTEKIDNHREEGLYGGGGGGGGGGSGIH